jgi:hypothetical protein
MPRGFMGTIICTVGWPGNGAATEQLTEELRQAGVSSAARRSRREVMVSFP